VTASDNNNGGENHEGEWLNQVMKQ
jgi:hypothetical protein